jgi:hypothetical protein
VTPTRAAAVACALPFALWTRTARGVDIGEIGGTPAQVDITETSTVQQLFDKRQSEPPQNTGWGNWLNRLNAALRWERWTAGLRLDSSIYWRRPVDNPLFQSWSSSDQRTVLRDNESRFENSIVPAKAWVTYAAPGVELTAGDAYVQFGRGLTLSMRKIDELGIDTTLRGAKIEIQKDPFALIAVAGFGNPSRIDEASGRSLLPTHDLVQGDQRAAVFGSDRIIGLDLQAGRGLPVTLSTHVVHFTRCAPYAYDHTGNPITDFWQQPGNVAFGTCGDGDTSRWLQQLSQVVTPLLNDRDITMVGQSLELPSLWGHGKLFVEAAGQQHQSGSGVADAQPEGNAVYGALTVNFGPRALPLTSTLEIKSNRNFFVVPAGIDQQRASEFSPVAYTFVPPAETFNMIDAEGTGNFNACVDGGRLRTDASLTDDLLVYAQGIYASTRSEQSGSGCDKLGRTISDLPPSSVEDRVWDGIGGFEWYFDNKFSHAFVWGGARDDTTDVGVVAYQEQHVEYSIAKYLGGPWSFEVQGRHRHRREPPLSDWWTEGENYVAVKLAPKWVFSQGFEYTTLSGQPSLYFNGGVLYRFTSASNVRAFVGQQRGAFRCASGICRYFPPFEGGRVELTLRF